MSTKILKNYFPAIASMLAIFLFIAVLPFSAQAASNFSSVQSRWSKSQLFKERDDIAELVIRITYYSAEYIEALVADEAEKNLWTKDETEQYKYQLLKTLQLEEYIPVFIEIDNNLSPMHLAPFDSKISLWIGKKKYSPVDYDKRFNFRLSGKREGFVYFPRFDEKTGKSLLEGVKSVRLTLHSGISEATVARGDISYVWDVSKDNPEALYKGRAASRLELDRLIKRLEKLNAEKRDLEKQIGELNGEISSVNKRVEELQKQ